MEKKYQQKNVYLEAQSRIDYIYTHFSKIYISFSGGKDSGVMLNMAIEAAKKHNKVPVDVLFIDLEAQYQHTIDYITKTLNRKEVNPYWVCLPLRLRNSISQLQPHWMCWEPEKKENWIRPLPKERGVISDETYFPFFKKGMEFEDFIPKFSKWFSQGEKTACLVGIRTDESLNRFRTIRNYRKKTFNDLMWSTKKTESVYNFYPIYDWKTSDIWIANGKMKFDYNKTYDLMHLAGISIHKQRLCQPFGDDQRKGLYLFKILEPETWAKLINRVEGVNFGGRYGENKNIKWGQYKLTLPSGHTYESYAFFLLNTMPPFLRTHYLKKIKKFVYWWQAKGVKNIPDWADPRLEAKRQAPSWRRVCRVLLKNDYWCEGLSFGPTKKDLEEQQQIILKYMNL